jgi:hypothetical protein
MFVTDNFPELGTDWVTALSSLDVNDFSHLFFLFVIFVTVFFFFFC